MVAFPFSMYKDPQKQIEEKESEVEGCKGCVKDVKHEIKSGMVCDLGIPGYPNLTKDDCDWWSRR